jgi:hypothetical protein
MVLLRYLLMFTGIGLLVGAALILIWDLVQIFKARREGHPAADRRLRSGAAAARPEHRGGAKR